MCTPNSAGPRAPLAPNLLLILPQAMLEAKTFEQLGQAARLSPHRQRGAELGLLTPAARTFLGFRQLEWLRRSE